MISEELLDKAARDLYAGVLSDACDRLGLKTRAIADEIRPIWTGAVLCGIAQVIHAEATGWRPMSPYARQIEAIDAIRPGSIVISTIGRDPGCALWGELFSTAARARGARGALIDGNVRDTNQITEIGFPVFARGFSPVDSYGRLEVVPDITRAEVGGVEIASGDLIFGDVDGIVAIPEEAAEAALRIAFEKHDAEGTMRDELRAGAMLKDAFARHQVL